MGNFEFIKQDIKDIILIKPRAYEDCRGFFMEFYKKSEFLNYGIKEDFIQDNFSFSNKNTLRGLHFQKEPYSQSKLVTCLKGRIIDVVVDIRLNSKTFKKYIKIELSSKNKDILYIPKGFAHGFLALDDENIVLYKTTKEYNKNSDCGIKWDDNELNIDWGIDFEPVLSLKDKNQKSLKEIMGDLR